MKPVRIEIAETEKTNFGLTYSVIQNPVDAYDAAIINVEYGGDNQWVFVLADLSNDQNNWEIVGKMPRNWFIAFR